MDGLLLGTSEMFHGHFLGVTTIGSIILLVAVAHSIATIAPPLEPWQTDTS